MRPRTVTTGLAALVLATLVGALLAAGAGARRDDLPPELFAPADGIVVKDATHGISVDFACPIYHDGTEDSIVTAPSDGYHVVLSASDKVDDHRLLLTEGRVDQRDALVLEARAGHCTAVPDTSGNGLLPHEPGTYYWQAYRECPTYLCPGGVEVSNVWSVTVRRTVCSVNRSALAEARAALRDAKADLSRRRTPGRRARVGRLTRRVSALKSRLTVVYGCAFT